MVKRRLVKVKKKLAIPPFEEYNSAAKTKIKGGDA
jgi:hypothetical protein